MYCGWMINLPLSSTAFGGDDLDLGFGVVVEEADEPVGRSLTLSLTVHTIQLLAVQV